MSADIPKPPFGERGGLGTLLLVVASILVTLGQSACSTQQYNAPKTGSWAYADPETSRIATDLGVEPHTSTGQSGYHLLSYGKEALVARLALADSAQHSIDAQYYIYDSDEAGATLTKHLIAAADRGVRIRLLVDDFNKKNDGELEALSRHPMIEVRIFNPLRFRSALLRFSEYAFDLHRSDRRMHNKLFIVDSEASVLGGRNVGDDYFDLDTDNGFRDFDLLSIGPVSLQAETAFDQFWNSRWSVPIAAVADNLPSEADFQALRAQIDARILNGKGFEATYESSGRQYLSDLKKDPVGLLWGFGRVVSEPPKKIAEDRSQDDLVSKRLDLEWQRAQKDVMVEASYFLPGEAGIQAFKKLHDRGVSVTIVTSGLEATDVPLVYATYRSYRAGLLSAGVNLYEFKLHPPRVKGSGKWYHQGSSYSAMHSKVIEFDHERVWVGSFNIDQRSVKLNTEVAIIAECPALARQLADSISSDLSPNRSWKVQFEQTAPSGATGGQEVANPSIEWVGARDGKPTTLRHDPGSIGARIGVLLWSLIPGVEKRL